MGPVEIICGLLCIGYIFYYLFLSPPNFWNKYDIKSPKPHIIFGNFKDVMLFRKSLGDVLKEFYDSYPKEKVFGIYARRTPILIVKDLDLIKDVLIKDFSNFMHRGLAIHDKVEPLSQHLFSLEPKRWRPLRIKMSPVFTSGKMKNMFYIMQECCDHLHSYLDSLVSRGEPIEVRELTAKFTTDVIGSCAFGLKMNAMSDEESEFRKMGRKIFSTTWFRRIKFRIRDSFPKLYNLLGFWFQDAETNNFFINSIIQTMKQRDKENIVRHDFVDILRELKSDPDKVGEGDIEMTDSLITSQAFVFFIAGFETSSTTISHMLYELAQNHDIQNKLRTEVIAELAKCEGKLKYESIKSMKYMHQVFQETLRKYPVVPTLMRQSDQQYTFTGTKLEIAAKQKVWIPVYSIHRDPTIYPNPDVFDPDRFTIEALQTRHPMSLLPFGTGPRNCIGERFAVYQVKTCLITMLSNYRVDVCEKTEIPYVPNPAAFVLSPKNGIYLQLTRLNGNKNMGLDPH